MSRVTDEQINIAIPVSNTGTSDDEPKRDLTRAVLKGIRDMSEAPVAIADVTGLQGELNLKLDASALASTDQLAEGMLNLYFTTARAAAAAPVQSVAGRTGNITLALADIVGLVAALAGKESVLTAGTNITIDRTDPLAPVISVVEAETNTVAVGTDLTLTDLHHGRKLQVTAEATITVPSGLRQDFEVHIMRDTSADFSVEAAGGVTLKGVGDTGNFTCDEGEWVALVKLASGENFSVIGGELAP